VLVDLDLRDDGTDDVPALDPGERVETGSHPRGEILEPRHNRT